MKNEKEKEASEKDKDTRTKPRDADNFNRAFELSTAGFTYLQIAAACGVSLTTINRWAGTALWKEKLAEHENIVRPDAGSAHDDARKAALVIPELIRSLELQDLKQLCIVLKQENWRQLNAGLRDKIEAACMLHDLSTLQFVSGLQIEKVQTEED